MFLANAYAAKIDFKQKTNNIFFPTIFLSPVNLLFYISQLLYMLPKKTTENVHFHHAFLHTRNYSDLLEEHLAHFQDI